MVKERESGRMIEGRGCEGARQCCLQTVFSVPVQQNKDSALMTGTAEI